MVARKQVEDAVQKALDAGKGRKKFSQSVDLAINFREVDFKKPENRLNVDVNLPFPPRQSKVAVFADGQLALEAKNAGADIVVTGLEIAGLASDAAKRDLVLSSAVLSSPQLIAQVGKTLGQALSAKGKTPKPILPNANLKELISRTRSSVTVKSKGKYLPTVNCLVGKETQTPEQISDNIILVLDAVIRKIPETNIASAYVKLTMGPAFKLM
ncbi:50S ribosomal protein L1 [Candidatus Micrarchaeota archaeon]|nr:50S ribosomal protein L1 [Candidatus Micrarchaeota archaeon]MBI5176856.1 50S ribosomal protein L1 [Candidatus Micrarchaeota archaeon]